jgi:hypothetical protein
MLLCVVQYKFIRISQERNPYCLLLQGRRLSYANSKQKAEDGGIELLLDYTALLQFKNIVSSTSSCS